MFNMVFVDAYILDFLMQHKSKDLKLINRRDGEQEKRTKQRLHTLSMMPIIHFMLNGDIKHHLQKKKMLSCQTLV